MLDDLLQQLAASSLTWQCRARDMGGHGARPLASREPVSGEITAAR